MRVTSAILALALAAVAPLAAGQAHKWVDEKGRTHYGDRPPAQAPGGAVAPPASSGAPASDGPAGAAPRRFSECVSESCRKVSRVDPTCQTSLCQEAMSLPDDCHTITCQGKRAELDKGIAQLDEARLNSAARSTQRRTTSPAAQQGADAARARAYERCKANRGVDCDTARGLAPWLREDRPITPEEQRAAAAARRARGY